MSPNETTTSFKRLRFYRDENTRWYVHLPDYPGPQEDLEMVLGADDLLDRLSSYGDAVTLRVSETSFEGASELVQYEPEPHEYMGSGAHYVDTEARKTVWLCDVTKFVYGGRFPDRLYLQRVRDTV